MTNDKVKATISLVDFMQDTTFHGVKFIFSRAGSILRRTLWVILVVTAISLFVLQVSLRTKDYYSYEANVDIQIKHNKSLEFPSVTLCNQNNFRLSKAVELGMYQILYDKYSYRNSSITDTSTYPSLDVDLDGFIRKSGHQLTDLVHRCMWNGRPCDMETDFQQVISEFGLCYTFNFHNTSEKLKIHKSGARYALNLVLNTENYEYMPGPHDDIGVKMWLHDSTDIPLMEDLGFTIAPSVHALLGIQTTQTDLLEPEHGSCDMTAEPRTECLWKCDAETMYTICGCRAPYFAGSEQLCTMEEYFGCDWREIELNTTCECSSQCTETTHNPHISTAKLSVASVDGIWKGQSERLADIKTKYSNTKEIVQRLDPNIVMSDTQDFSRLSHIFADLEILLNMSIMKYGNGAEQYYTYKNNFEVLMKSMSDYAQGLNEYASEVYYMGGPMMKFFSTLTARKNMLSEEAPRMVAPFNDYLSGRTAHKATLYQQINDYRYDSIILQFHRIMSELSEEDILYGIQKIENAVIDPIILSYLSSPGLITQDYINDLALMDFIEVHYGENNTIRNQLTVIRGEMTPQARSMENLLRGALYLYKEELLSLLQQLTDLQLELTHALNIVKKKLILFEDMGSHVTNVDNYIKIDVYYQQLTYTIIQQKPAFGFISLLSEVGGFLGLLLGASVLSVFELIDFLIVTVLKHFSKQSKVDSSKKSTVKE